MGALLDLFHQSSPTRPSDPVTHTRTHDLTRLQPRGSRLHRTVATAVGIGNTIVGTGRVLQLD